MAKIIPTRPFLLLLYGFPGAGKTYFARQFCDNVQAAHLQADRIRSELFEAPRYDKQENMVVTQLMDYMTEEFLSAGLSVVYDVNVGRAGQRRVLRDLARRCHANPMLVWFQMDSDGAFTRTIKRDRRRADGRLAEPRRNILARRVRARPGVRASGRPVISTRSSCSHCSLAEPNQVR